MNSSTALHAFMVGIIATAVLDGWMLLLGRLGIASQPMAFIGRWVGHMGTGRFFHAAIRQAAPIQHEVAIGWTVHYATGVAFAALLVVMAGPAWLATPSLIPALLVGAASVVMPLFVMQPAMGAGFASSRTPTPFRNVARSVANHLVMGAGFYVGAMVLRSVAP